jgi:hypothetical protein
MKDGSDQDKYLGRWSTRLGTPINQRELKLRFFYLRGDGVGPERITCRHSFNFGSRGALAAALGLGDAQLEGSKDGADRLSDAAQRALGSYFGFDIAWKEWTEGTASDFAKRYNTDNWYEQRWERRDGRLRLRRERPQHLDSDLARFNIDDSGQYTSRESPFQLFLQLDLSPANEEKYRYGFSRVSLRLFFRDNVEVLKINRFNDAEPIGIGNASLRSRGTDDEPEWVIEVKSGVLDGEYATREKPLVEIFNPKTNQMIEAQLVAKLHDGSLRRANGMELTNKAKAVIIKILMSKKVAGDTDLYGMLRLGIQKLIFVESDFNE